MARWISLRASALSVALLAAGCASSPARPPSPPRPAAPSSADLDAWVDAEEHAPARSTTLRSAAIAEAPAEAPTRAWGTRTIAVRVAEAPRPLRRAPIDVSFQRSDMANAFQLLADAGRFNLVMADGLSGTVSATLRRIDPYDALKAMAEANGVDVRWDGQVVLVKKR